MLFANFREKSLVAFRAVVGVGPGPCLPRAVLPVEGDLGVDAAAQVDAVGLVFHRGEDQFARVDVTRVQVDRAGDGG